MTGPNHRYPPSVLTVAECADVLRCSPEKVLAFIRSGELKRITLIDRDPKARRRGGASGYVVRLEALEAFLAAREGYERHAAEAPAEAPRVFSPEAVGTDGKSRLKMKRDVT